MMRIIIQEKSKLENFLANKIISYIKQNPKANLGLATGETFVNIYNILKDDHKKYSTDYSKVTTFNLDEYTGLEETNPHSYHYYMNTLLFNHINIKRDNAHLPNPYKYKDEATKIYNNLLYKHPIDIQLLGLGGNGHIGFNEPNTPFSTETHQIKLTEQSRRDNARFFDSVESVPKYAVTMGIKNIMNAKKIYLVATGEHKARIVEKVLMGEVNENCPASILQKHDNVTFFLDHDSTKYLSKDFKERYIINN